MTRFRGIVAGIYVTGVCKDMGVEPNPQMMWSVGQMMQRKYMQMYGVPPPKDNRPKTYEEGVHCMAIYPEHFRPYIEKAIMAYGFERARQGDLFGDSASPSPENLQ
jgi:hypothetical protein